MNILSCDCIMEYTGCRCARLHPYCSRRSVSTRWLQLNLRRYGNTWYRSYSLGFNSRNYLRGQGFARAPGTTRIDKVPIYLASQIIPGLLCQTMSVSFGPWLVDLDVNNERNTYPRPFTSEEYLITVKKGMNGWFLASVSNSILGVDKHTDTIGRLQNLYTALHSLNWCVFVAKTEPQRDVIQYHIILWTSAHCCWN